MKGNFTWGSELGTKAPQIHELICCFILLLGLEKQGLAARKFYQFAIRRVTLVTEPIFVFDAPTRLIGKVLFLQ